MIFKDNSESNLSKLDQVMEQWSDCIAEQLAERRFFEKKEFAAFAKINLLMAINDCIKINVTELEDTRKRMVKTYAELKSNRIQYGAEIAKVNVELKRANRLKHTLSDYDEYRQLRNFIRDKIGPDVLADFINNYLDTDEYRINKHKESQPEKI